MELSLHTLLVVGVIGNLVATIAKWVLRSPRDDARVDALHAKLDDILAQIRPLAK